MFRHFITVTFRNLIRYKSLTTINLLGLTVGLTCVISILLWIRDEKSYDQFHPYKDRLFLVLENIHYSDGTISTQSAAPGLLGKTLKEDVSGIIYTSTMDSWTYTLLSYENRSVKEEGRYVSEDFLKMFSFPLLSGDHESALSEPNSIVISKRLAEKLFPGIDPMHKTIKLANWSEHKVTGVLHDLPSNTVFNFEFLLPFDEFLKLNAWAREWDNNGLQTWVMIDEQTDISTVNQNIKDVVRNHGTQDNVDLFLQPLTDVYLRSEYKDGKYQGGGRLLYTRLFGFIALLVLMMACVNFVNLSTARASIRAKEVGVRKVVGASRNLLMLQFFGEATVLCSLAALLSIAAVFAIMPSFNLFTGKALSFPINDGSIWIQIIGLVVAASTLGGIYPALMISAFQPAGTLKGQLDKTPKGAMLRKGLVIMQFAIAVFLIMAMIITHRQLKFLQTKYLGYQKEHLVFVSMSYELQGKYDLLKQELGQSTDIVSVSASNSRITGILNATNEVTWEGKSEEDNRMFAYEIVSHDFIKTIGAELREGRDFSKEHRADSANYVINETAAKEMGLSQPYTGQRISVWDKEGEIIGVVKDFNFTTLRDPLTPLVLMMNNLYVWTMYVRVDGTRVQDALSKIEQVCKKYSPAFPFEYTFADAAYTKLYASEQVVRRLSSVFAFVAILISCLGLFGLAMFTAERRVKEIGIRKVLGASIASVVALMSKDFLSPVLISLIVALPVAAYFLNTWLTNFAYHIDLHWWLFAMTAALALGIAIITISYQSIKAALTNPVASLRSE